jgi:hypothetical protein
MMAATRQAREKPARDLFWSKRGVVACATHAPAPASEHWNLQGWQQAPAWRQKVKLTILQCQFCRGRPYVHHSETKLAG